MLLTQMRSELPRVITTDCRRRVLIKIAAFRGPLTLAS
jgi:hypothetical protein